MQSSEASEFQFEIAKEHFSKGLKLIYEERYEEAEYSLKYSLKLIPKRESTLTNLSVTLLKQKKLNEAREIITQIFAINPLNAEAWLNLGSVELDMKQNEKALACFDKAISIKPEYAEAWFNRGIAFTELQYYEQGLASYDKAISIYPEYAAVWFNRGDILTELQQYEQALASYEKAISIQPEYAAVWFNRGIAFTELKQYEHALVSYDRAIFIKSDYAEVWSNRGNILTELQQYEQAISSYDKSIEFNPDYAEVWFNRANTFTELKKFDQALASYDNAIAIKPNFAHAWANRGIALRKLKQYEKALASYDKAIELKPDYAEGWANRGNALFAICQFEQGEASLREAIRIDPNFQTAHNNLLLNLNYSVSFNPINVLEDAKYYGSIVTQKTTPKFTQWSTPRATEKLRIGFVSGDLRNHSVGYFIEGLITNLDKTQFEIYAFPTLSTKDDLTNRLLPFIAEWIPIYGKSDSDAAAVIHQKGIHVLIDLSGHSERNRLAVFSYKPAPIQVSWLGLPMTTGVPEMDYVLGDPYALPQEFENQFTEAVWRLPESYLCFTPPDSSVEVGALPALSNGYLTFTSFNNLSKMNNKVVEVWSNILKALPTAKLLLKTKQLSDPSVSLQTKERFSNYGVNADRLLFKTILDDRDEHLATYNEVDIALDTFPYPGVTTSVEANWMGVPVLALKGNTFLSATATSIANNAGLGNWVASDTEDYVDKAIEFASNLDRLALLRSSLRNRVLDSSLFDSPRFAKNFGDALCGMWSRHLEKNVKNQ